MEFLVKIDIALPPGMDTEAEAALRSAERSRAEELAEAGVLQRLWRVPGAWANWGLWSADDEAGLTAALDSLPLRPYMTVAINVLEPHPSDPGP